jgi:hypothetical protein
MMNHKNIQKCDTVFRDGGYRMADERVKAAETLTRMLCRKGYPEEFGRTVAAQLGTEKTIGRMISYLSKAGRVSAEDIVDEMLAIMSDRDSWVRKKKAEYYNSKYNELLLHGLEDDED